MTAVRIFSITEAQHFCKSLTPGGPATPHSLFGRGPTRAREGTQEYDELRSALLRSAERDLFLALTHYRRSGDLMIDSSAPWAHVTLYYGCFYAARAILGTFGAWLGPAYNIDVQVGTPGRQILERRSAARSSGSHRRLWNIFYPTVASLRSWVSTDARLGLAPVLGDEEWLIATRNSVNYENHTAFQLIDEFGSRFDPANFPASLPGDLNTMFSVCRALTTAATELARLVDLASDGLQAVKPPGDRQVKVAAMWSSSAPDIEVAQPV